MICISHCFLLLTITVMLINYLAESMLSQHILASKIYPAQCKCWSFNGNHSMWGCLWKFIRLLLTTVYHSSALLSVLKKQNNQFLCFKFGLKMDIIGWYGLNYYSVSFACVNEKISVPTFLLLIV